MTASNEPPMPTATENAPAKEAAAELTRFPASTEICAEADRVLNVECVKADRSRAYVLRQAIHEWARKHPNANRKLIA